MGSDGPSVDVAVLGGGPAGATAALVLAQAGIRVCLVEQAAFPRRKVCGEYLSATNWPLLERLGIDRDFLRNAGPEVRECAIMARDLCVTAPLPQNNSQQRERNWGRALGRDVLDQLLVREGRQAGAEVLQPTKCTKVTHLSDGIELRLMTSDKESTLHCKALIAAHGSWHATDVTATAESKRQSKRATPRPSDLLGFKAHFTNAALPSHLMPLLSFDGGYGGMVVCDQGRTSLSCCLRRDHLESLDRSGENSAGAAVLQHIRCSSPVINEVLGDAELHQPWLAAGPIRPGIRTRYENRVFYVGNAAGEAHPIIAEGISMAMQSGWLAAHALACWFQAGSHPEDLERRGQRYADHWRRAFSGRLKFAATISGWAMRPSLVRATCNGLGRSKTILKWGARLSGKSRLVIPPNENVRPPSNDRRSSLTREAV